MPWEKRTVMTQREQFVEECAESKNISELCRKYGISRKTGYKWLNRASLGRQLCDQSRRPNHQPSKTALEIEAAVLRLREDNPAWGGLKIKAVLESDGVEGVPSARTCSNILKRNGMISPEASQAHTAFQRFEREKCNSLWQTDFKGDFALLDGSRCYPLDIIDDHSRFCIRLDPKSEAKGVQESFLLAFQEFGLPYSVLSDNGAQFAGFKNGYTQFERWLMDLDVFPIHGRIWHPQTQGKIERFHRSMKAEALRNPLSDLSEAKRVLKDWRWKYNEVRPHSAIGMKPPASVYTASSRPYLPPKEYVYDSGAKVVKVSSWGYLRFGPVQTYLSETMADTYLQIIFDENSDSFKICYRNYQIALWDNSQQKLVNKVIHKL